jgi:hypothetical protein
MLIIKLLYYSLKIFCLHIYIYNIYTCNIEIICFIKGYGSNLLHLTEYKIQFCVTAGISYKSFAADISFSNAS